MSNSSLNLSIDTEVAELFRSELDRGLIIVDVGAQNLANEEHVYHRVVQHGLVKEIIGFEPQSDRATERSESDPLARIIPEALGDGATHTLYCNNHSGTSSFFPINPNVMGVTDGLDWLETTSTKSFPTRRLDDIPFADGIDLMKLDTQGAETMIISHGVETLKSTLSVYCEIMFRELYLNQPHPGDLLNSLTKQGFQLHNFYFPANLPSSSFRKADPQGVGSALFWADALFFKLKKGLDAPQLVRQAVLSHYLFGSRDLTFDLLETAVTFGAKQGLPNSYLDLTTSS